MGQAIGKLFGGLTNSGVTDPSGNTQYGSPAQNDARTIQSMPPTSQMPPSLGSSVADASGGAPVNAPPTDPTASQMPQTAQAPSFIQAMRTGPGGMPNATSPLLTTKGKILTALLAGARGGMAAAQLNPQGRNMGFGGGFEQAESLPFVQAMRTQEVQRGGLENQQLQAQIPFLRAMNIAKLNQTQSEVGLNQAKAQQAGAEAQAVPYDTALKQAQAAAADVKEDPIRGLIRISTGQPVAQGGVGMVPADAQMAAAAGIPVNTPVPLKVGESLKKMANEGVHSVSAGGRSLLVDGTGKTIKDLGAATPVVVNNMNNPMAGAPDLGVATGDDALKGMTPQQQTLIKGVANYTIDPNSLATSRSGGKAKLIAAVKQYDPNYDEKKYGVIADVQKSATSGPVANTLQAFNTAIVHMDTFQKLADAMDNGDNRFMNGIGNSLGIQFGSDKATNFAIAKAAFMGEVGKAFAGANVAEGDRTQFDQQVSAASSPAQLKGAAATAKQLLLGKRDVVKQSVQKGMQGEPNFGNDAAASSGLQVGQQVTVKGKQMKVTAVHPDGSFDAQ